MSETTNSKCYIDAHCHLADERFETDLDSVLNASIAAGVGEWIQGGVNPADWARQREIKARWPHRVHLAFGLHPWWISEHSEAEVISAFQVLALNLSEAAWLGEVGLDYLPKFLSAQERQILFFKKQLELNQTHQKPLILHVVRAHSDALTFLKDRSSSWKGMVHAFSEGKEIAKQYLDLGFVISVGGACTRSGYTKLKEAIEFIPEDRLVIETDAPDQTPEGVGFGRTTRNEPRYLIEIASDIAKRRKSTLDSVLERSGLNLKRLMGP